jgi:hypothetical protein
MSLFEAGMVFRELQVVRGCVLTGMFVIAVFCGVRHSEIADAQESRGWRLPEGVSYKHTVRKDPRPLQIHELTIDLRAQGGRLVVASGADPDGEGPAEAVLMPPNDLARSVKALAAINTSAWAMLADPQTGKKPGYVAGGRADVSGWVKQGAITISPPQAGYWSLWMDGMGKVSIGQVGALQETERHLLEAKWAVSGFRGILKDGQVLHPRTAAGLSADAAKMIWLVVDGRQKGFSEGVSEEELARLLLESGCAVGINLDGGGSSSMWLRNSVFELEVANRPSEATGPRPVPVMLSLIE